MNYLKVFEAYVLRTISSGLMIGGIIYLLNHDWKVGIFIIIFDIFVFGGIGQSLKHNREKTTSELLTGQDFDFKDGSRSEGLSQEESRRIAKPYLYTIASLMIISVVILFHQNFHLYIAIPVGFIISILLPTFLYLFGVTITKKFFHKTYK